MGHYSRDNYEMLLNLLYEYFGFEVDRIDDTVVEFIYADEIPMFRLVYVESTATIAACFHVAIGTSEAFEIMDFIRSKMPKVKLGQEYIVDANKQTLVGQEAYDEMERAIQEQAFPHEIEKFEYKPDHPISYTLPHAVYHANDPRNKDLMKQLEEDRRYFGRFKWQEE